MRDSNKRNNSRGNLTTTHCATQNREQQAHTEGSRGSQPALEGNTETPVLPEDSAQCLGASLFRFAKSSSGR